ncbi:hypothetical protein AYO47_06945 [Planctomyces sp. SCGC AG-212-M04]|nr:hypothetical protein AYO47_06945 [Planctomyces sp. SCGC AG-212-M04]
MSDPSTNPPPKPRRRRGLVLATLILVVAALGWWHRYVEAAYARLAYNFARVDSAPDVRYQPGQEDRAKAVAGMMDDSVQRIESVFDTKLTRPVVYCLRTEGEYGTYTAAAGSRGSCTVLGEVCLSPKIQGNDAELRGILVHEMTHATVLQRIGPWKHLRKVPAWFDEGLAVYVSNGGGAEKVSEAEAREAILAGKHFDPERTGKAYADVFGLSAHMFYRQAGMFIGHLIKETPAFVPSILTELERGLAFPDAFERAAGQPLPAAWAEFEASLSAAP